MNNSESLNTLDIEKLAELDAQGFLIKDKETFEDFIKRVDLSKKTFEDFSTELEEKGELTVFGEIKVNKDSQIPKDIISSSNITENLYDFKIDYVPGFFSSSELGPMVGGCMIGDEETNFSIFLIRKEFEKKTQWLVYDRDELFAHELCHSMRQSICDLKLEEFFAYQTSKKFLRRYLGNCFVRGIDGLLFIIPSILLLVAQIIRVFLWENLWIWPFYTILIGYMLGLLIRNQYSRNIVFKAKQKLISWGIKRPMSILIRSKYEEIKNISKLQSKDEFYNWVEIQNSLRWQVINYRFIEISN